MRRDEPRAPRRDLGQACGERVGRRGCLRVRAISIGHRHVAHAARLRAQVGDPSRHLHGPQIGAPQRLKHCARDGRIGGRYQTAESWPGLSSDVDAARIAVENVPRIEERDLLRRCSPRITGAPNSVRGKSVGVPTPASRIAIVAAVVGRRTHVSGPPS